MLEAHELTKVFDDFLAVDCVSMTISVGTVLALLARTARERPPPCAC
jgi:ABC-type uncharacterized transport system ATPase subunit